MIQTQVTRGWHSSCGIHQTRERQSGPCRYCAAALQHELDQHVDTEPLADKARRLSADGKTTDEIALLIGVNPSRARQYVRSAPDDRRKYGPRARAKNIELAEKGKGPLAYDKYVRDKRNAYKRADAERAKAVAQ